MAIIGLTLALFTLFNSLRLSGFAPQIARVIEDKIGAEAISFGTWALFLASPTAAMAFPIENYDDWNIAVVLLSHAVGSGAVFLIAAWKCFATSRPLHR